MVRRTPAGSELAALMAMTTLDEYGDLLSDDDGTTNSAYQFDALG